MATTTPAVDLVDDADQQITRIALARVRVGPNTRTVTDDDVATMAGSIELQGQLTPVFVYPVDGDPDHDYELDGGETRYRALVQLGATHINAIVRASGRASAAAAENFSRRRPDPLAEARAVRRMMVEDGLTQAGAAQAAGLGRARVAAVLKILDLPEDAQTLVGQGVISLAAVDALLAVGEASTTLLDATIAHLVKHPRDSGRARAQPRLVHLAVGREHTRREGVRGRRRSAHRARPAAHRARQEGRSAVRGGRDPRAQGAVLRARSRGDQPR